MQKSNLYYIHLSNEADIKEKLKDIYNKYADDYIFITNVLKKGGLYSCWSFENSFLRLNDNSYLIKAPSYYSPNDIAGILNEYKPVVLSISTAKDTFAPFGFKFCDMYDMQNESIDFWEDVCRYKDMPLSKFWDIDTKEELLYLVKENNIDLWGFDDEFLDKIEREFLNGFDASANIAIVDEFENVFGVAYKSVREMFKF